MRKNIIVIAIIFTLFAGGGIIISYFMSDLFWQALVMGLSVSLIQMVLGIWLINIYLDRKGKKNIAKVFLMSSDFRIVTYHNRLLEMVWGEFGQKNWGDLVQAYVNSRGNPSAISAKEKSRVFNIVKNNYSEISHLMRNAGEQMNEITKSGALTLDENLYSHTWAAKEAAKKFLLIDINNSTDDNIAVVFKCCVDFDLHTQEVRNTLYKIAVK